MIDVHVPFGSGYNILAHNGIAYFARNEHMTSDVVLIVGIQ